ncbi:hypothetical protein Tco_0930200, partial [Tanacetum coccineum]
MVPQALLTKSGLVYVNSLKRLFQKKTPNYNRYFNRSVNSVKDTRVHTARPKTEVNTVKASARYARTKAVFARPGHIYSLHVEMIIWKIIVPAVSWSCSMVTAVLVASVYAGRRDSDSFSNIWDRNLVTNDSYRVVCAASCVRHRTSLIVILGV